METSFFFRMRLSLLARTYKEDIVDRSLNFFESIKLYSEAKATKKKPFKMIIIIPMTSNFIAAVHGLHLSGAQSHSSLFLFSFWMEHVEKGLRTM